MTASEMRWRRAWSLLSLDRSTSFFRELWLWIDDPPGFQARLRVEMTPWLASVDMFYDEAGELDYALSVWFIREFGLERFWHLSDWVRRIFLQGGADRATEFFWGLVLNEIRRGGPEYGGLNTTISSAVVTLCEADERGRQQSEERLANAVEQPLSQWDADILRVESGGDVDTQAEDATDTIGLIMNYNLFLELWDQYCAHLTLPELRQLHSVGVEIATRRSIGEEGHGSRIAFPGSWQADARRFLKRFQSEEKVKRAP